METIKYNNENKQPIKVVLFYAMELVGFNPKNIDNNSLDIIINSLVRSHKDITIDKFKEAFELGANGKLDIDLNTYQNFNTLYVSNVLSAFRRYKRNEAKKNKVFDPTKLLPETEYEKKQSYLIIKNDIFLKEDERNGKSGTFPDLVLASWKNAFNYLLDNNQVKELTGEALKQRLKEIEAIRKADERNPKKRMSNALISKWQKEPTKTMLYYKLEVINYFKANKLNLI